MIQESRRLIAQSLINYTKLPITKQAVFEEKTGEYMFRRVRRPGCPLSEYDLRDQLIDCTSAILKELNFSSDRRLRLLSGLRDSKPESIGQMLLQIISA